MKAKSVKKMISLILISAIAISTTSCSKKITEVSTEQEKKDNIISVQPQEQNTASNIENSGTQQNNNENSNSAKTTTPTDNKTTTKSPTSNNGETINKSKPSSGGGKTTTTTKPSSGGSTTTKPSSGGSTTTNPAPVVKVGFDTTLTSQMNMFSSINSFKITKKVPFFVDILKKVASGEMSVGTAESKVKETPSWEDTCSINNGLATIKLYSVKVTKFTTKSTDINSIDREIRRSDAWSTGQYTTNMIYTNADGSKTVARIGLNLSALVPSN